MAKGSKGTKVGGAYIEISADSAPAEKAVATFFNWFTRTGEAATDLASKISNTVETAKDLGEKGSQSAKTVSTGFQSMHHKLKDVNASLSNDNKKTFEQIRNNASKAYSEITKDSEAMNRELKRSVKSSLENLESSYTDLKNGFKTIGNSILDMMKNPIEKVKSMPKTIQNAMKSVTGFVSSGFAQAKNQAISQIQQIPTKATQVLNRTKDVFVTGFNSVVNTTASAVSKIGNGLSQLPSKASQAASNIKTGFINGIKNIPNAASNIWQSVKHGVKTIADHASGTANSVRTSLSNGFKSVLDSAKSILPNVRNQIKSSIDDPSKNAKKSIEDIASSIASIAIVSKAFNSLKESVGKAIDRMDTIDTATKSLTVLTGSSKIAKRVMDDLSDAIDGTPIALNEVALGAKKMVAAGMEGSKVKGVFKSIADAAYGVGNGAESIDPMITAFSRMQTASKLSLDPIRSLEDVGVPAIKILANQFNMSTDDMEKAISDGSINSLEAIDKLTEGMQKGTTGAAGATSKMEGLAQSAADTISGSLANFRTSITSTITEVLAPFKNVMIDTFKSATASVKNFRETVIKSDAFQEKLLIIESVLRNISKTSNPLVSIIKGIFSALGSYGSLIIVISLFIRLKTLIISFFSVVSTTNPFIIITVAIIGVAVAITDLYKRSEKFRQLVAPLINFVKRLGETFVIAGNAIHGALELIFVGGDRKKTEALRENLNQLLPQQTVNVIIDRLTALHKAFGEFKEKASEKFGLAAQAIKGSFDLIFTGGNRGKTEELKQTLNNLFPQETANKILERLTILHKAFDNFKKAATEKVQTAATIIKSSLDQILNSADRKQYEDLKLALSDFLPQNTVNVIMDRITVLHEGLQRLKTGIKIVKDVLTGEMGFHEFSEAMSTSMFSPETIERFEKFYEVVQLIKRALSGLSFVVAGNITSFEGLKNLLGDSFSDKQLEVIYRLGEGIRNFVDSAKEKLTQFKDAINKAFDGDFGPLLKIFQQLLPKIIAILVGGIPGLIITGSNLISKLAEGMGTTVPGLLEKVSEIILNLVNAFTEMLPKMIEIGVNILGGVIQGILQTIVPLAQAAITVAFTISKTIIETLLSVLPQLIESGIMILTSIITGIIQMLPNLISAVISVVEMILSLIITYLPKIIEAGMNILVALIGGIMMVLPKLIEAAMKLIISLVTTLIQSLPKVIGAGIKILGALIQGVIQILPKLIETALKLIITIAAILIQNLPTIIAAGVKILLALGQGILNTIGVLIKMLPQVVGAIFKAFGDIEWGKIGKDIISGIGKGITDAVGSLKKSVTDVAGNVSKWFKDKLKIKSPSRVMAADAKWVPEGVAVGIKKGLPVIETAVSSMTDMMTKAVEKAESANLTNNMIVTESYGMPDATQMQASAQQASKAGNQGMADSTPQLLQTALSTANGILGQFTSISPSMILQGTEWMTNFMTGWNSVVPAMMSTAKTFIVQYTALITLQNNPNYQMGRTWMQNKLNGWNSLVSTFITTVRNFCNQVLNLLRSYYSAMYQTGRIWLQNLLYGWNSLYQTFINRVNQLGNDAINNLRSKSGGFNSAGRFLMQSLIDGINSMGGSLSATMNNVANKMVSGIGKGVNGVIGGVNYVLKEVESSKKLGDWSVPQYSRGTDGHPQDGPAIVNDQKGSKYQEIIQEPDGSTFIAKGRNALVWLKKGAKVLNATMTERVLKAQQSLGSVIPHYADGVGEFDIVDFLDDENAVLKFLNSKVNYSGINEPWLDMTKSGVKLMTGAANKMIQGELEKFFTHGTFDGAMGANNVYKYLVDIAQKMMSKFPGLTITSGYRAGDPYYHGKHQALDLAYPGVVGSAKYTEAANWAFEKFVKQIAYVITNGKVRDRMGLSGTGASGQWVTWPDGDHFDHIHLNGSMGSGDIFTGGSGGSSYSAVGYNPSAGVEQWRSLAIKALKMEGQYSAANLNAMLRQIQTESGGNPNAVNNWDINAQRGDPSRGLLQTISTTFKAYARPGYDKNMVDPLSNMLASIRYAVSRYGSLLAAYRGVGYENGGWITQDGLYRAGEKGKPEVVLPVTKPARAMELIGQALNYMIQNGSGIIQSATTGLSDMASNMTLNLADLIGMETHSIRNNFAGSTNIDFQEVISLLNVNNQLLAEIRDKETDIYMDKEKVGKKVAKTVAKENARETRLSDRRKGRA